MGGRIPPNLLYLTIYNPSLRPTGPIAEDDEDAEEQAHILFYTAKERAVSRDRMLRQIGLAKALVNFSQMFNTHDACNNIHSQSKRLLMVSPEPNFWIHAAIEVAKVPRPTATKGKGKEKSKSSKDKGKEAETVYDYIDGSVRDVDMRQALLKAYERFKLTHGSFTQILDTLGQEALGLQLERFFTVWAWSWNLEDGQEFREHLGIPLHPSHRIIEPLLDESTSELSKGCSALFIYPPHFVPSTNYKDALYPSALGRHLQSLVPPSPPPPSHNLEASDGTIRGKASADSELSNNGKDPPYPPKTNNGAPSGFLGMPGVNLGVDKWKWPEYLTFGIGTSRKASPVPSGSESPQVAPNSTTSEPEISEKYTGEGEEDTKSPPRVDIDPDALKDAIAESITPVASPTASTHKESSESGNDLHEALAIAPSEESGQLEEGHPAEPDETPNASASSESLVPEKAALPEVKSTQVHLSSSKDSLETVKQRVFYASRDGMLVALIGLDACCAEESLPSLSETLSGLLEKIEDALVEEQTKTISESLPSATKILQPTDTHIISYPGDFTLSNTDFTSKSGQLYAAQEIQSLDPEISEVFSRGQNPQHWHIARRGLGSKDDGSSKEGEVYMAVYRKEASLGDVDNVLAGVVRRCHNMN